MTHRERVRTALSHQEPDRVPIDIGSTGNTGIALKAYERLKAYLGIESPSVLLEKPFQLARVASDDQVLERLGVDTRGVFPRPRDGWEDRVYPDGSYQDEWGLVRAMPEGGFYYDVIEGPFQEGITPSALDRFDWPNGKDPSRVKGVREEILAYHQKGYAVVVNIRGGLITVSQLMRGFEGWFTDIVLNPGSICDLMDRILQYQIDLTCAMLDGVGDKVDVVAYGDDIGTQNGPMVSPATYRKYIKPRQARLIQALKEKTSAWIHYHTCGSVYTFIPDLIEIGVDILNPVQVSAKDMDPARLKREFGDKLSFWGGIDTHRVLPYGTPDDVRAEVKLRLAQMAEGGGYVLNSVHNIQADVPPENVVAMFEAALEYGGCDQRDRV
ncbi:MAG: uroporphyrinogen decarboxylase family protein [Bacillota bacterium]